MPCSAFLEKRLLAMGVPPSNSSPGRSGSSAPLVLEYLETG